MLQDNFDGYWLVIKYRIIIVMFTIDENRVSEVAILRKKVGEPKEEIRNLHGFHMNSSNDEFTCMNSFIWIHLFYEFI